MRLSFYLFTLLLISCADKYLHVKSVVQKNCDRYISADDIKVVKRNNYYVSYVLNDSIYTNIYYFVTYGNDWDETIMVADDNMLYWLNDSLCKEIILVNNSLMKKGIEIGELYVNGLDNFSVRTRSIDKKYLYKIEDVRLMSELLSRNFK